MDSNKIRANNTLSISSNFTSRDRISKVAFLIVAFSIIKITSHSLLLKTLGISSRILIRVSNSNIKETGFDIWFE